MRDVAEQYGYEPIRYLMVASHYRSPINYSTEIIEQCKAALDRLYNCRENLTFLLENAEIGKKEGESPLKESLIVMKRISLRQWTMTLILLMRFLHYLT